MLEAVLDFQTDWGEYIVEMEEGIWQRTSEAQAVDELVLDAVDGHAHG